MREEREHLTVFPDHFCHVGYDGEFLFVTKRTGDIRPNGFLWEDSNPRRLIFLGRYEKNGRPSGRPFSLGGQTPGSGPQAQAFFFSPSISAGTASKRSATRP